MVKIKTGMDMEDHILECFPSFSPQTESGTVSKRKGRTLSVSLCCTNTLLARSFSDKGIFQAERQYLQSEVLQHQHSTD